MGYLRVLRLADHYAISNGAPYVGLKHMFMALTSGHPELISSTVFARIVDDPALRDGSRQWVAARMIRVLESGEAHPPEKTSEVHGGLLASMRTASALRSDAVNSGHLFVGFLNNEADRDDDFGLILGRLGWSRQVWEDCVRDATAAHEHEFDLVGLRPLPRPSSEASQISFLRDLGLDPDGAPL